MISSRKKIDLFGGINSVGKNTHADGTQTDGRANDNHTPRASATEPRDKLSVRSIDSIGRLLRHRLRAIIPEAVRARIRPYRKPEISQEQWEQEYRDGCWSHLQQARELAHYSVITGYYTHYRSGGSLLDVGCGEGVLQRRLYPLGYSRYLGIDKSQEAIARAQTRRDARTEFRCADAETYSPQDRFDVIIFNEVLYYLKDPVDVVRRVARALNPDGIAIISMLRWTSSRRIWRSLDRAVQIEDGVTVTHHQVGSWDVKVIRQSGL
jgi:2-polyprenyl-3-methyl-5-hydroxy-6-metoxy-1,4-benzoquinol methylase